MQLLIKIAGSAVGVTILFLVLRWLWTHDIDFKGTAEKIREKTVAAPDWIVTKDPKKIYQHGKSVGDVSGPVKREGKQVHFAELSNTTGFKHEAPFEYQNFKLRLVRFGQMIGFSHDFDPGTNTTKTATGVFQDVLCDVID